MPLKENRQEMRILNELNPFNLRASAMVALSVMPWLLEITSAQARQQDWRPGLN